MPRNGGGLIGYQENTPGQDEGLIEPGITSAMIDAGLEEIWSFYSETIEGDRHDRQMIVKMYKAMSALAPKLAAPNEPKIDSKAYADLVENVQCEVLDFHPERGSDSDEIACRIIPMVLSAFGLSLSPEPSTLGLWPGLLPPGTECRLVRKL